MKSCVFVKATFLFSSKPFFVYGLYNWSFRNFVSYLFINFVFLSTIIIAVSDDTLYLSLTKFLFKLYTLSSFVYPNLLQDPGIKANLH